jgi:hypothetical protein
LDASDVGVGAVLFQEGKDDIDLPNCYVFLKHWQRSEKRIHNWKKWLALFFSLKQLWYTFHPFVILQEYNLIIKHIKCKDNFISNDFSRVG